jgi:hypothetical protein
MNIIQSSFILELLKIIIKNLSNKKNKEKKSFLVYETRKKYEIYCYFTKQIPNKLNFKIGENGSVPKNEVRIFESNRTKWYRTSAFNFRLYK